MNRMDVVSWAAKLGSSEILENWPKWPSKKEKNNTKSKIVGNLIDMWCDAHKKRSWLYTKVRFIFPPNVKICKNLFTPIFDRPRNFNYGVKSHIQQRISKIEIKPNSELIKYDALLPE